jgi:hypothetical protein
VSTSGKVTEARAACRTGARPDPGTVGARDAGRGGRRLAFAGPPRGYIASRRAAGESAQQCLTGRQFRTGLARQALLVGLARSRVGRQRLCP